MNLKKSAQTVFVLIAVIWFADNASSQTFLTNGLVVYLRFDGNANDASGNGNDGLVSGASLTNDRFGVANSAYHFAGDGSNISISNSPTLDMTNALTLSVWVKLEPGGLVQPRILTKHVFDFGLTDTSGNPQLFFNIQNYPNGGASLATSPLHSGQWIFLTGTYDRQTLRIYTNGTIAAQMSTTVPIDINTLPVGIGKNPETGTDLFKGYIDDVRIYNRALSSLQVAQLYAIESELRVNLIKAVKPSFSNLSIGTNYQLQVSSDLNNWTNQGAVFTATNSAMIYPQYFDVDNWGKLFFRLQVSP